MAGDVTSMGLAEQIALWSEKLRDLSALGLRFCQDIYDRAHFQTVQDIALEMMALAKGKPVEELEPLRGPLFSRPTPMVTADAAIIDRQGRILLIQRSDNGRWALPGGALEVGEPPSQGVVREALEETGLRCRPVALVGVFDSLTWGSVSGQHLCILAFLCEPLGELSDDPPTHALETLDVRWFAEQEVPSDLTAGHGKRIQEAYRVWREGGAAFFDQLTLGG